MIYFSKSAVGEKDIFEESITSTNSDFLFVLFIILIIIGAIAWRLTHPQTKERRYFSTEVKRQVLKDQNYKCAICKRNTGVWDYDHKNGNRSNNKISNCQALCPNCHAKKTRGLIRIKEKPNSRSPLLSIFFIIVFFIVFLYFGNV